MLTAERIEDFGTLQLHARHLKVELEFFQKRNTELAKELASLKELSPEQLSPTLARERRTRRASGAGAWPRPIAPNLWLVGDSVFPGQSTLATALGGLRVAEALAGTRSLPRLALRG